LTVNGGRGSPPDCIAKLPQMAEFKKVLQLANTCQKLFSFFFTSRAAARFLDGIGRPGVSTAALLLTAASGGGLVAYADSAAESAPEPSQDAPKKKVLVLGTGWAGTSFLKNLDCSRYEVKVISPRNYFAFTPLLPSVTCGTVEPRSIIEPIRRMFEKVLFSN